MNAGPPRRITESGLSAPKLEPDSIYGAEIQEIAIVNGDSSVVRLNLVYLLWAVSFNPTARAIQTVSLAI
jgi:hypothetical protein